MCFIFEMPSPSRWPRDAPPRHAPSRHAPNDARCPHDGASVHTPLQVNLCTNEPRCLDLPKLKNMKISRCIQIEVSKHNGCRLEPLCVPHCRDLKGFQRGLPIMSKRPCPLDDSTPGKEFQMVPTFQE